MRTRDEYGRFANEGPLKERFEQKYIKGKEGDCWEWVGVKVRGGYGQIGIDGKMKLAHRVSYELYVGNIPDGLCACHRCDNPGCVNPNHLFLGTYADNVHDRENKGRGVRLFGEEHGGSKLTEEQVKKIRALCQCGYRQVDVALMFGMAQPTISQIVRRCTWINI